MVLVSGLKSCFCNEIVSHGACVNAYMSSMNDLQLQK